MPRQTSSNNCQGPQIYLYPLYICVKDQLVSFISDNQLLSEKHLGFVNGRSTTTNILYCDTLIANLESRMAAFYIIAFDFRKAFDKVHITNS